MMLRQMAETLANIEERIERIESLAAPESDVELIHKELINIKRDLEGLKTR